MVQFILGILLAIFFEPLIQNLEVLFQQFLELQRAKLAKEVYDINKQMECENENEEKIPEKHYGFLTEVSPNIQQQLVEEQEDDDPSEQEEED